MADKISGPQGPREGSGHSSHPRPRVMSQPSSSAPPTPHQHARDAVRTMRTPSPEARNRKTSAGSDSPESRRVMPSMRAVSASCRFQSTQTSRRRMPYNIGSDPLEPERASWSMTQDTREQITRQCEALYDRLLPSPESQRRRDELVVKLQRILEEEMPDSGVRVDIFGSSGNLLYTSDSDVDVCVTMFGKGTVCSVAAILAKRAMKKVTCVHAKSVPIVKIWDPDLEMACDLNVNNQVALVNTRLVRAYMRISTSARKLAMLVKHWTQRRVINEASGGTLSSYTWTLLVINFLQINNILPVIPLADQDGKAKDDFSADVEALKDFGPKTSQPIGDLFYGFFEHYGFEIDFETSVFSVRSGVIAPKSESRWSRMANNNRLCVEEPFNTDRNLGNTADDTAMRGLHQEMRDAARSMGTGKVDIEADICKQFEYPQEEPRHAIFERPPQQPRPVLTRSRSQAGRGGGGRGGASARPGNRNYDSRAAATNRRASSGISFGQMPIGMMTPDMWVQMDPYMIQQDLNNLTRRMSHEQERLRQVQQAIMEQRMQNSNLGDRSKRRSFAGHSLNLGFSQGSQPGSPGTQTPTLENGPLTAPMFQPYGSGFRLDSAVPMSHSSSHQGTSSRQSSPMFAEAVPVRREPHQQMQVPDSPSASQRSRSQPARPMNPAMPMGYSYIPWTPAGQQMAFNSSQQQQQQQHAYLIPRYPVFDPRTMRYAPMGNMVPREYVGYGISGNSNQQPTGIELSSIPAYEDLQRQGRPRSPVPRDEYSGFSESPSRALSTISSGLDELQGMHPHQGSMPRRSADQRSLSADPLSASGPVIANGSGTSLVNAMAPGNMPLPTYECYSDGLAATHLPTLHRNSDASLRSFADRAAAIQFKWADPHPFPQSDHSDAGNSYDSYGSHPGVDFGSAPHETDASKPVTQPPQEHENEAQNREEPHGATPPDITVSPSRASADLQPNGQRRAGSHGRPNLAPLDLGLPSRAHEGSLSASKVLSPVQETRTPSPTASRKSDSQRNSLVNGKSPQHPNFSVLPTPPTPLPAGSADSGPGSMGPPPLPSHMNGGSAGRGNTQNTSSAHQWQQAGSRKKKNRSAQSESHGQGGMPMPANVAERKGG